jgi:hypothetical protein
VTLLQNISVESAGKVPGRYHLYDMKNEAFLVPIPKIIIGIG